MYDGKFTEYSNPTSKNFCSCKNVCNRCFFNYQSNSSNKPIQWTVFTNWTMLLGMQSSPFNQNNKYTELTGLKISGLQWSLVHESHINMSKYNGAWQLISADLHWLKHIHIKKCPVWVTCYIGSMTEHMAYVQTQKKVINYYLLKFMHK